MTRYEYSPEMQALLESSLIPFAIYQFIDKRVVTLVLSQGFLNTFGYEDRAEAYYDMDNNMYRDTYPDDRARVADAAFAFATEGGKYEVIYRTDNRKGDGYRIVHAVGEHFITDTGVQLAQVWYMDEGAYDPGNENGDSEFVRKLNSALRQESILRASFYDYLTGLPSMTYFFELAQEGCKVIRAAGSHPAFMFMDLSGMKFFNHKHGFAEGDNLLRSFAQLLVSIFSNENCSRFDQDHFAVFTDEAGIEERVDGMFREWQSTNNNKSLPVRAGIYLCHEDDIDISSACDCARMACNTLRNTFVSAVSYYDNILQEDADKQHYVVGTLDRALRERWIEVYYQPIVRAVNGKVCDEEALARWNDPVRGMLSPADFIPILEETKLIYKLDLYVVDRIIDKIRTVSEAGLYIVPQSVNLSRSDFDECDMVSEICRRIDAAGLDHSLLTIEITESIVGADFEFIKKQVERFRKLGFQVWMDDFGSGYSSLDVLHSLDFDLIKFDMRFLQQLEMNGNGRVILTELMRMATSLGLETVCEGVETEEQVGFLREIGCSKLQGYYYSKPEPVEHILDRYRTGVAIGFEDPRVSSYYETIGRLNLHDLNAAAKNVDDSMHHYFNSLPMAIYEIRDDYMTISRSNQSYRRYLEDVLGLDYKDVEMEISMLRDDTRNAFIRCMADQTDDPRPVIVDERMDDGSVLHLYLRKVAENPTDGTIAILFVVLAVSEEERDISYAQIARVLAADYFYLFYVNLDTEEFIWYTSEAGRESFAIEQRGANFFAKSREDAYVYMHRDDAEGFVNQFTKENILKELDENGRFTFMYRMKHYDRTVDVRMTGIRMEGDSHHIIIGVSGM